MGVMELERTVLSADPRQVDAALRTQLADISMASQVLLRRCENEKDEAYLAEICRAAVRAVRILEQVELGRRLEDEDELRAVYATVDLVAWCREVAGLAEELLALSGVTVRFTADRAVLLTLADEALLERMVYELISNGVKAMEDGGELTVSLLGTERSAVITVGDEGRGLSERVLARLSGQGDGEPDLAPEAGAGLGLRLARIIAEVHGGFLMLDTAPGRGVRAAVSLPLREGRRERLRSPSVQTDAKERARTALSDVLPAEAFIRGKK